MAQVSVAPHCGPHCHCPLFPSPLRKIILTPAFAIHIRRAAMQAAAEGGGIFEIDIGFLDAKG